MRTPHVGQQHAHDPSLSLSTIVAAMSCRRVVPRTSLKRLGILLTLLFLLLSSQSSQTQAGDPPGLNFFKNFFVTGNYVVASVDFGSQSGGGGFVEAEINFNDPEEVPADADVVGAFLYWQTIVDASPMPVTGVEFRGEDISEIAKEVASAPLSSTFSPCWSGGGQGTYEMKTFRADVLRFLPVPTDGNGVPIGKRLVNLNDLTAAGFDPHTVRLPDNGTGNQTPQTAGASLIIIYRLPSEQLTSIVLYDGLQLKPGGSLPTTTSQILQGFYQASADPLARLTLLVGSGAKNATEQVRFGSGLPGDDIIATNPFFTHQSNSPGSDRAWDGLPWDVSDAMPNVPVATEYGEEVTVRVTHTEATPYDCLATSAIVFSTTVEDSDFDGLLNVWETGDLDNDNAPLLDPTGAPLPDLNAMEADPDVQDVFIEIGFMSSEAYSDPLHPEDTSTSTPTPGVAAHTHLPSAAVLNNVAAVFAGAANRKNPANPNGPTETGPIKVHFDVGALAADPQLGYQASPNVIKYTHADGETSCLGVDDPDCLARGGEEITELEVCSVTEDDCSFPGFRGVVGWKLGFRLLRDQPLSHPDEAACEAADADEDEETPPCVRRFDRNRRHMFRYALFAHALGIAREDDPTTDDDETKFPRSISGVSDAGNGGGDFMVTLGFWDNHTGTEFMQTSTIVHEFGHTAGLRHGGSAPVEENPAPNCKPNYESVMSYLFQVRGLIGPTGPKVDLSRQDLNDLNEASLTETALKQGNAAALFPTRWYAPLAGSFLDGLVGTSASTRHCDGTPLEPRFLADGTTENPNYNAADSIDMVRVDGTFPVGAVDWNASGTITAGAYAQDVNFNGDQDPIDPDDVFDPPSDGVFTGWNDWEHLDLRQTGSRRNPASLSLEVTVEDLASAGDPGYGDPGYGDPGYGDPGYGDPGYGDPGYGDPGYGDPGYGDPGYGDPGYGDPGYGGEMDIAVAESLGPSANSLSFTITNQSINLKWLPPHAGGPVASYHVWKSLGPPSPTNPPVDVTGPLGIEPGTICYPATQSIFCDFATQKKKVYYYFVVTWFENGKKTRSEILKASR